MNLWLEAIAPQVLNFWFGDPDDPEGEYGQQRTCWFRKDPRFDQQIQDQFSAIYERIHREIRHDWLTSPGVALAVTVVLDQFPRNLFRGTARSYEADDQALSVAQTAIARQYPQAVLPVERMFFYLPLEHSEALKHQDQAVAHFEALVEAAPELRSPLEYAYKHREVIRRFGRFPHRNAVLGRESTSEEIQFLRQPGSRF